MSHLFEYQNKTGDHFPTIYSPVEMYLRGFLLDLLCCVFYVVCFLQPSWYFGTSGANKGERWIPLNPVDPEVSRSHVVGKKMASWMSSFFWGKGEVLVKASIFVLAKMILVQPLLARFWFWMFFVFTTYLGKWFILTTRNVSREHFPYMDGMGDRESKKIFSSKGSGSMTCSPWPSRL